MNKRRIVQKQQLRKKQQGPNRLPWIIGGVVVAAIAIVGLIVLLSRPAATQTAANSQWPQAEGTALGPADAPVKIRVYSDYQCPFCKRFNDGVQQQIIDEYVRTGKAHFEYHHFIVIDSNVGGNESRRAAQASECAAEQDRFWDYHELLFSRQAGEGVGTYSDDNLRAYASEIGLDTARFNTCLSSNRYAQKIMLDEVQARQLNVGGTPALFVNGDLVPNPTDWTAVKTAIDAGLTPEAAK